jgi:ribosomal protein S18 acetylase RimI-like enzyme
MALEIRPFAPSDEPALVALWRDCGLTVPWNDPHRDIARKMQAQPDLLLLGFASGRLVATVMVGYDGHRGWINYLGVAPDCRRQGFGAVMMAEAESRLRALGCPKINLQVRGSNAQAIEFYNRIGFKVDDCVSLGKRLEFDE